MIYFAQKRDCEACALKPKCCRTFLHEKLLAPFMNPLVTGPVRSQRRWLTPSHVAKEKRSRCSSLI
jgi:hypothetical protein